METDCEIFMFGNFDLKVGRKVITEGANRYSKRWKLMQYLITHRERRVSRDELIMEMKLNNNTDPGDALSALVYRLRSYLREEENKNLNLIKTVGSTYTFNDDLDYWLDAEEFENLCFRVKENIGEDAAEIIRVFPRALDLYRGDYLEESSTEEWIWTSRNYYRDMLVTTLLDMDEYLRSEDRHSKLWEFYDKALKLVKFDERLLMAGIETLIDSGREGFARKKYEEAVEMFEENDYAIPEKLKKLGKRLDRGDNRRESPSGLLEDLKDRARSEGALVCDPDTFARFYELEKRRGERDIPPRHLAHVRLKGEASEEAIEEQGNNLMDILEDQLRSGDIICRWNYRHFMVLLANLSYDDSEKVVERLGNSFNARCNPPDWLEIKKRLYEI